MQPPDFRGHGGHTTPLSAGYRGPELLTWGNQNKDIAPTWGSRSPARGTFSADKGDYHRGRQDIQVPGYTKLLRAIVWTERGSTEGWFGLSQLRLCSQRVVFPPPSI